MTMALSTLSGIWVFKEAAETLSFKKAADNLGSTPVVVGNCIKALEKEFGGELFLRTTRKVELSDLGKEFYAAIHNKIHNVELQLSTINDLKDKLKGKNPIRIGCHKSLMSTLAILLDDFKFTDELSISSIVDISQVDWEHEADLILDVIDDVQSDDEVLGLVREVMVASPAYLDRILNGTQDAVAECTILLEDPLEIVRMGHFTLKTRGRHICVNKHTAVQNEMALIKLAVSGGGILKTTKLAVQQEIDAGLLSVIDVGADDGGSKVLRDLFVVLKRKGLKADIDTSQYIDHIKAVIKTQLA